MSLEIGNYNNILIKLSHAVKMHNFYPVGHPHLDSALDACYQLLMETVKADGEIKWTIDQKGFYHDGNLLAPGNNEVAGLARKAFYRKIKEIIVTPKVTTDDLKALLDVLKLDPDEVSAEGGVETIFAKRDVDGLLLNEMSYENLMRLKEEFEAENEEALQLEEGDGEAEEEAGEDREEAGAEEEAAAPEAAEETLAELTEQLKGETDFLKYNDLSVRIKTKTDALMALKRFDEVYEVLTLFLAHSSDEGGLPEDLRGLASEVLTGLLTPDVFRYLVLRAGHKWERDRERVHRILLHGDVSVIDMILDALVEAPDASTRRNLYNTVILFGDKIKPRVIKRLASDHWYEVRQMIALLGDLRDPETLDALEEAWRNEDLRVKKEVLKSLVKIPSPKSREMLISALGEDDLSLKCQALISMGVSRNTEFVDTIGEQAVAKGDPEVRKEAVKALGLMKDPAAVPYLTRVLFKKAWINKKTNEEIRALAAASLGMIGTEEALAAVEKVAERSEGELHMACRRILDGREKS